MLLEDLTNYIDSVARVPLWFILDIILSARLTHVCKRLLTLTATFTGPCSVFLLQWNEDYLPFLAVGLWIVCIMGVSAFRFGVTILYLVLIGIGVASLSICSNLLMLQTTYNSWDHLTTSNQLIDIHVCSAAALGILALIIQLIAAHPHRMRYVPDILMTCSFALLIPIAASIPVWILISTNPTANSLCLSTRNPHHHISSSEQHCSTPAWHAYARALLDSTNEDEKNQKWLRFIHPHVRSSQCPASSILSCTEGDFWCDSEKREWLLNYAPYFQAFLTTLFFVMCLHLSNLCGRLVNCIKQQFEEYSMVGLIDFLGNHWERLQVPRTLAMFWFLKLVLIVILGPSDWPVIPGVTTGAVKTTMNISFIDSFMDNGTIQLSVSVLRMRSLVGSLVHGSETWISVFGAAAFFGALAMIFVSLNVFLLDPSGSRRAELALLDADAPRDLRPWNVIEDPEAAIQHNDVLAVELLSGVGWSCAVCFLFIAFQYDLPSLTLSQRVYCSLYGLMVMVISCIHPIQTLLKSFLLRLGIPGQDSSWMSHIRLLAYGIFLVLTSCCIVIYAPRTLVEHVVQSDAIGNHTESTGSNTSSSDHAYPLFLRFPSSVNSLKVRQLRIILCGCQLVLSLLVTLAEYGIYLYAHLNPDWYSFRPILFWTKIVTSVVDYMLSVLSFLTVCWLSVYDSICLCRLFIIFCHFYYILYPSAVRACKWVVWRLMSQKRINSLSHPTEADLISFDSPCPICFDSLTPETAKLTRCGHIYHTECLVTWMRRQLFCPICHADLFVIKDQSTTNNDTNLPQADGLEVQ